MTAFPILLFIALGAVVGALGLGLLNMARGGDPKRSNRLMQWRVALQAVAIFLIVIGLFAARHG